MISNLVIDNTPVTVEFLGVNIDAKLRRIGGTVTKAEFSGHFEILLTGREQSMNVAILVNGTPAFVSGSITFQVAERIGQMLSRYCPEIPYDVRLLAIQHIDQWTAENRPPEVVVIPEPARRPWFFRLRDWLMGILEEAP